MQSMIMGSKQPIGWPALNNVALEDANQHRRVWKERKQRNRTMMPTAEVTTQKQTVTKTVFDLSIFDDVKLKKDVQLPAPVTSVEEALAAVNNDAQALIQVINDGLAERAIAVAKKNMDGFVVSEEISMYKEGDPYDGKFAEGDKSKQINGAVLNLAKAMNPSWDTLSADQKRKAKDAVIEMLRANPAMLAGLAA